MIKYVKIVIIKKNKTTLKNKCKIKIYYWFCNTRKKL